MPTFRVLVRGRFDRPDDATRARLSTALASGDFADLAFTPEGTLSYNEHLVSFSFRVVVETSPGKHAERDACEEAMMTAMEVLDRENYPYRALTTAATCMDDIKIRRR